EVEAYEVARIELERLRRHGVTAPELARAKARLLRSVETAYNERETTASVRWADELVRHVTTGEPVPGIAVEWSQTQELLPTIEAAELQSFARDRFLPDPGRVVHLRLPQKPGLTPPTVEALQAVDARVASADIPPPEGAASEL